MGNQTLDAPRTVPGIDLLFVPHLFIGIHNSQDISKPLAGPLFMKMLTSLISSTPVCGNGKLEDGKFSPALLVFLVLITEMQVKNAM